MGLTCQPVLYTTAVTGSGFQGGSYLFKSQLCQVLGFKEAAICLISFICIFLGLGDLFFFVLSFLILIADTLCFVYVASFQHLWKSTFVLTTARQKCTQAATCGLSCFARKSRFFSPPQQRFGIRMLERDPFLGRCLRKENKILSCEVVVIIKLNCKVSMGNRRYLEMLWLC